MRTAWILLLILGAGCERSDRATDEPAPKPAATDQAPTPFGGEPGQPTDPVGAATTPDPVPPLPDPPEPVPPQPPIPVPVPRPIPQPVPQPIPLEPTAINTAPIGGQI